MHHEPDEVITYLEIGPPIICHVVARICHRGHTGPPPQELVPGVCSPAFEFTSSLSPGTAHLTRNRGRTTPLTYYRGPGALIEC